MKKALGFLAFAFVAICCDKGVEFNPSVEAIKGSWLRDKVYVNGEDLVKYFDYGKEPMNLQEDMRFDRMYESGTWIVSDNHLTLEKMNGRANWTFEIVSFSNDEMILEIALTEGEYCCDFQAFESDAILNFREVYRRPK